MPCDTAGLGSSPFARRYWGNRCYFLFLAVLRCFSSHRSPPALRDAGIAPGGLPHSDIRGSLGICPSPRLFAACHVLLRLREPRHPPCALRSFRFNGMPDDILLARALPAPPKPFLPTAIPADGGARCFSLSFYVCLLASQSRMPRNRSRFHHVNVLFSKWRITESNR